VLVSKWLGVVYLLVISQANERQGQALNKGRGFSSCPGGTRGSPGSCQAGVWAAEPRAGCWWPARASPPPGAGGARGPAVHGPVPPLPWGIAVGLAAARKMPRSGCGGKPSCVAAHCDGCLPLSGTPELCPARLRRFISLLLQEKQSKRSPGLFTWSFY